MARLFAQPEVAVFLVWLLVVVFTLLGMVGAALIGSLHRPRRRAELEHEEPIEGVVIQGPWRRTGG